MGQEQRGRWVYIPHPEEVPVTFQIGMVGSDGVLLASDQAVTRIYHASRLTSGADKIVIHPSRNVAYCCAGGDESEYLAREICDLTAHKSPSEIGDFLYIKSQTLESERPWSIFLAYRWEAEYQLFRLGVSDERLTSGKSSPLFFKITTHDYQGDRCNTAGFFMERYLGDESGKMPLDVLKRIASHVIIMASKLTVGVSGLEIVLCKPDGFRRLDDTEISSLKERSKKLDSDIGAALRQ